MRRRREVKPLRKRSRAVQEAGIRLVLRAWLLALVIGTVSGVIACRPPVDRARADTLAEARLQEYIRAERLNREQFDKPEVHDQAGKWLYTYEYGGAPRQSVA